MQHGITIIRNTDPLQLIKNVLPSGYVFTNNKREYQEKANNALNGAIKLKRTASHIVQHFAFGSLFSEISSIAFGLMNFAKTLAKLRNRT